MQTHAPLTQRPRRGGGNGKGRQMRYRVVNETKLLDAEGLLAELFPPDSRPTVRWLREQQRRRSIPFVKLGRLVFFDPIAVREAIATRHTIKPRQERTNGASRMTQSTD